MNPRPGKPISEMSAVCAAGGTRSRMNAPSCPYISFRFVPSRFMAPRPGQPVATSPGCRALPCGPSSRPRRPAIRWSAGYPRTGAGRPRARRLRRRVGSPTSLPGQAVPRGRGHTAACCAVGQPPVTDLTCRAQWALDGLGAGLARARLEMGRFRAHAAPAKTASRVAAGLRDQASDSAEQAVSARGAARAGGSSPNSITIVLWRARVSTRYSSLDRTENGGVRGQRSRCCAGPPQSRQLRVLWSGRAP